VNKEGWAERRRQEKEAAKAAEPAAAPGGKPRAPARQAG
jgi:hypothetical protein